MGQVIKCRHENVAVAAGEPPTECELASPLFQEWGVIVLCFCTEWCIDCSLFLGRPLECATLEIPVVVFPVKNDTTYL